MVGSRSRDDFEGLILRGELWPEDNRYGCPRDVAVETNTNTGSRENQRKGSVDGKYSLSRSRK